MVIQKALQLPPDFIRSAIGQHNLYIFIPVPYHRVLLRSCSHPAHRILLQGCNVLLEAEELSDVWNTILNHRWTLHGDTPSDDRNLLRQAHWQEHLRPEDSAISHLDPFVQHGMETKNLHRWLCIRIVGWLEAQVGNAQA